MTPTIEKKVELFCTEGNSDKVYRVHIISDLSGCWVNFQYGRRNSTLTSGSKTPSSVPAAKAEAIYDKLVREKLAKGYRMASGAAYGVPEHAAPTDSGFRCQLLNEASLSELETLLFAPDWGMQQKHDGERRGVIKENGVITGINRKGQTVPLPACIIADLTKLRWNFQLDAEIVGEKLYVFDLISLDDESLVNQPFIVRFDIINTKMGFTGSVQVSELAFTPSKMHQMFHQAKAANWEGVVLKHLHSRYTPGRPNSGGTQLKFKFKSTASCIVAPSDREGKRSIALDIEAEDGKSRICVGNVTIPPNHSIPPLNSVVEVEYLYAFKGGSLFQPVYKGQRDDINVGDCGISQLKYKPE